MVKNNLSLDETIVFLNSLLEVDRKGMSDLFQQRAYCNEALADHETVQVYARIDKCNPEGNIYKVGILGLLNGLFGKSDEDGYGAISMSINDDGLIEKFERIR